MDEGTGELGDGRYSIVIDVNIDVEMNKFGSG